jgi:hypothetical protein
MSQANVTAGTVRRTRLRQLGIVVGIVGVILIATACSSVKDTPKPNSTQPVGSRADIASLLAGIPQRGNILGDPNAPLTLQYFGGPGVPDLQGVHAGRPSADHRTVGARRQAED